MAKYTPTLMNTQTTIAPLGSGFVDKGASQLDAAISRNIQTTINAKNKAFEQAKELRDGIVSGFFSDSMAEMVGDKINELSGLPTYSRQYAKTLAEANADLGLMVQKQNQITTKIKSLEDGFANDPSKKYYNGDNLNGTLHDQLYGGTYKDSYGADIVVSGTGIDTKSNDLDNAYTSFKNNTNNIKDGEVRLDFQKRLGEVVNKAVTTGDLNNVNSEFAKFNTTTSGSKFLTGFGNYDASKGMYVPNFDENNLPPSGLVEMYRGIDDAAARLMDVYVQKKSVEEKNKNSNFQMTDALRDQYQKEFVLEEMKKMAPGGGQTVGSEDQFRNRPQGNEGTGAQQIEDIKKYNSVKTFTNNMAQLANIDPNDTQLANIPYSTVTVDGEDVRVLDVTSFGRGTNYNVATYDRMDSNGTITTVYDKPRRVLLNIEDNGARTIYFEGGDEGMPTYEKLNERTATTFLQNTIKSNFGSGSSGQKYFDSFQLIGMQRGDINDDGSYSFLQNLSADSDSVAANRRDLSDKAAAQGTASPVYNQDDLNESFSTSNSSEIDNALLPINKDFMDNERVVENISDRNGNSIASGGKIKLVKFERDGDYYRDFKNSYGTLSYQEVLPGGGLGEIKTKQVKAKDIFETISQGPGSFDIQAEK